MRVAAVLCWVAGAFLGGLGPALAAACPGNPTALGTSRTIAVDPVATPLIGNIQYKTTLPLGDREVALTFDDGPLPPYTNRILEALAAECVKVTYFLVGRQASAHPDLVRRIVNEGHVIGTHSQNHPLTFDQMDLPRVQSEIDSGIASVQAAAGDPRAVAPFFRIPGLLRNKQVEGYLGTKSVTVWSADETADDWFKQATAESIVSKAMSRLEARGRRGILLLHDIHPATAMAVPMLLRELKAKGYRIVQAVPAGDRPKTVPDAAAPALVADASGGWPRLPKNDEMRPAAFKANDTKPAEVKPVEVKAAEVKPADVKPEIKPADSKATAKTSEVKTNDVKTSEAKKSDSKNNEKKSADNKPTGSTKSRVAYSDDLTFERALTGGRTITTITYYNGPPRLPARDRHITHIAPPTVRYVRHIPERDQRSRTIAPDNWRSYR
jgi:peptidoglycan/xylan/chitin deacetylase (PgdA/CDA1 family)